MTREIPILRLKPKADARKLRRGSPWVFANEVVTDRRTRGLQPGTLARLEDGERRAIALVAVNPNSRIIGRVLDGPDVTVIDQAWFEARLARALALREALYDAPFYRLIHAEADGMPGVIIDRFGSAAVVQPNAAWADRFIEDLANALALVTGCDVILKNASGRARSLEGLDDVSVTLRGQPPEAPLPVPMNGAHYMADLTGGQKTGLFFDQRPNHAFVARLARSGGRVLDVFSHVGGFSLAALVAGADRALAVDGSAAALALASQGAEASGVGERFETRQGDAFEIMQALVDAGERFEHVVCDPPAFAPTKKSLDAGLRAYERVARLGAQLTAPGGFLTLCSCSHAADISLFRGASNRGIGRVGRQGALLRQGFAGPDHPQHPQLAESAYLKALTYRL